jgi:hypothetical protein
VNPLTVLPPSRYVYRLQAWVGEAPALPVESNQDEDLGISSEDSTPNSR